MKYYVSINKPFRNIKVYKIIKRVNENTNAISRAFAKLVDKYIVKKK
jgi:xanthine dehydrogenase iron-sulfur cluster and FAD-binding subunit A